jgi:hypothetical protein
MAPLALFAGSAGPVAAHDDDERERAEAFTFRRDPRVPRGPGHGAAAHDMRLVGFNDLQARTAYQPVIQQQGHRWIAYVGHHGERQFNPLTGVVEPNGTSILDVTDPARPRYLHHIPGQPCPIDVCVNGFVESGAAQMVRVCSGDALPKGVRGKFYLLRVFGNDGHQIWDVTVPEAPALLTTVVSGLNDTHKSFWECDTGIAYLVSGEPGWRVTRMTKIYDLSDPTSPVFIRDFGLVGQQPGATGPIPVNLHGPISYRGRVYFGFGTSTQGVLQIVDRKKLLEGDNALPPCPAPPARCDGPGQRFEPTPVNLKFPEIGRLDLFPSAGAHSTFPVLGVPVRDFADNSQGATRDFVVITNESLANRCQENRQLVYLADVSDANRVANNAKLFSVSNFQVPEAPGQFCDRGGRFGSHSSHESFTPIYYGRVMFFSWFNAGVRAVDIRDPFNPVEIGFYIPATNSNTEERCATINGVRQCAVVIQTNNVEVDDRGYVYIVDRANSGLHILELTGDARKVANFPR